MGIKIFNAHFVFFIFTIFIGFVPKCLAVVQLRQTVPEYVVMQPGPVVLEKDYATPSYEDCEKIPADDCLDDLQTFLRVTELPFTSEENDLNSMCMHALNGYNCSAILYRAGCLLTKQRELLPIFISSAEYLFLMLCKNSDRSEYLRDAFLSVSQCILENKKRMECCAEETGVSEMPVLHIIEDSSKSLVEREITTCCPLSRYLQCTYNVINENCGEFAANFTHLYIRRAAGEEVEEVCQKMHNYPDIDSKICSNPIPVCSGSILIHLHCCMLISMFVCLRYFFNYQNVNL
ncbi:uncharacterized protein TNCT_393161 [Trichonephila clavata]|uniref:Uncharacterized protein n=1 Tax=Trichonephila clavata TaxID=2740835 RepID=A0A8X6F3E9_TRICU|nr:uncharacterized protein TNCT_393161 [Trichonephila clavata]